MRTPVNLNDTLLAEAKSFTGIEETSVLLREALTALIEREAARRLACLGGSDPNVELGDTKVWTHDKKLQLVADAMGISAVFAH